MVCVFDIPNKGCICGYSLGVMVSFGWAVLLVSARGCWLGSQSLGKNFRNMLAFACFQIFILGRNTVSFFNH